MSKTRIEREKETVAMMIRLYCRKRLGIEEMPAEDQELMEYAFRRLDGCKYGEKKLACKHCPTHCYKPAMREKIREVMRWAGPRMMLYSPIAAIRHIFNK